MLGKKLIDVKFNPGEKGDERVTKPDMDIEEFDTFKHYY